MKISLDIKPFPIPTYVELKLLPRNRQQGFAQGERFPLSSLDEDVLARMCQDLVRNIYDCAGKPIPEWTNHIMDEFVSNQTTGKQYHLPPDWESSDPSQ